MLKKFQNLFYFINNNKNNHNLLSMVFELLDIVTDDDTINAIVSMRKDIDPNIEAIHILAYNDYRPARGWNQFNWEARCKAWFRTAKRDPLMALATKDKRFESFLLEAANALNEKLPEAPQPEQEQGYEPVIDTLADTEKIPEDTPSYNFAWMIQDALIHRKKTYEGPDLSGRAGKLLKHVGFHTNHHIGGEELSAMIRKLIVAYDNGLILEDLQQYLIAHHWIVGNLIADLSSLGCPSSRITSYWRDRLDIFPEHLKPVEPEPKPEPLKLVRPALWQGKTTLPPSRLTMMVDVIEEDGDELVIRTVGPVHGKYEHRVSAATVRALSPNDPPTCGAIPS